MDVPFLTHLGIQLNSAARGRSELELILDERHLNSWQVAHGGVIMTLLDAAMSLAGRSLQTDARAGVTIEMKTSFLKPAGTTGSRLIARGTAFHQSTTMCFCEGEVMHDARLIAKAMGTFKYLRRLDVAARME